MTPMTPEQRDKAVEAMAKLLRIYRQCEAGEVICPFCLWAEDESNPSDMSEVGCVHIAGKLFDAAYPIIRKAVLARVDAIITEHIDGESFLRNAARKAGDTGDAVMHGFCGGAMLEVRQAIRALGDET